MSNRKAISRKEIDSRWFYCGETGRGRARRRRRANIEDQQRGHLRSYEHTGSFSISPSTSSSSPFLLQSLFVPCISHSSRIHAFSLFLSLARFLFRSLLRSTAFIIKIKCKIVPRTSFPNGIKLRARSLYYHCTHEGRKDRSFVLIALLSFLALSTVSCE